MKHIFLISLLGAFVSVSAMGGPYYPPEIEIPEIVPVDEPTETFDDDLRPGLYLENENDCLVGERIQGIHGALCLPGYYCPGQGSISVTLHFNIEAQPIEFVDDILVHEIEPIKIADSCVIDSISSFPYGLNKCPDGTTSDAGAESVDDCYPIESPAPSRTPGRIAKDDTNPECDDTTLGTASGTTDFEADWTANTINITWVGNGATVSGGATTCTYDSTFNLPTAPTKTGYNFAGWKVVSQ